MSGCENEEDEVEDEDEDGSCLLFLFLFILLRAKFCTTGLNDRPLVLVSVSGAMVGRQVKYLCTRIYYLYFTVLLPTRQYSDPCRGKSVVLLVTPVKE